ncbi:MAG: Ezrin/radixin/moesin family protein [Chryseolinea sp.]
MKRGIIFLFCLILMAASTGSFAQLSKKEKKEWKKKAKEFKKNPQSLKTLSEDKVVADNTVVSQTSQISTLQGTITEKDAKITQLEDELTQLRSQLAAAKAELEQMKTAPANSMDFSKGVVFKVQIGAFKNKNLAKYFDNNPNFGGEAAKDGEPQKLTIGIFRDYWEADTFKKYMREMGVKDAWIVPYKDGTRVEIKDVLEGVVSDAPADSGK